MMWAAFMLPEGAPWTVAQAAATPAEDRLSSYSVRRWTTEDGLPQNHVVCVAQTPDGYLWCGTHVGLVRFDGRRFLVFDRHNTPELAASDTIYSLAVDQKGKLWSATARGLVTIENAQFHAIAPAGGWQGVGVAAVFPSSAGGCWVASSLGLFHGVGSSLQRVDKPCSFREFLTLLRVVESTSGAVFWFDALANSIALQVGPDPGSIWPQVPIETDGSGQHRASVVGRDNAGLWMVTQRGLAHVSNAGELRPEGLPAELETSGIATSGQGDDGSQWFVDGKGLMWRRKAGRTDRVSTVPDLRFHESGCIVEDSERNVWVSSSDGLCRLRPHVIETLSARDGLPHDETWSVCAGKEGRIWVSSRNGVASVLGMRVGRVDPPQIPSPATYRSVLEDSLGRLFLGVGHGLGVQVRDKDGWRGWIGAEADTDALYQDRQNRLWSLGNTGVSCWDGARWKRWSREGGLPIFDFRVAHQSKDGAMWFGNRHGDLVRLDEMTGTCVELGKPYGLTSDEVWCIEETEDGALWLGTQKGLHRVSPDLVRRLAEGRDLIPNFNQKVAQAPSGKSDIFASTPALGMPEDAINWILSDDFGHFWLSGLRGIHRVNRADLEAVVRGGKAALTCATYGVADGMPTAETNGEHQPAGCRSSDGRLWFPTGKGLVVIDPRHVNRSELPPNVVLEEVFMDGESVLDNGPKPGNRNAATKESSVPGPRGGSSDDEARTSFKEPLRLPSGRAGVVRFTYTAPTFLHAEKVRFRHRLKGLAETWHDAGTERVAYFTTLRPGDYVFEVIAANAEGLWSKAPTRFAFS